MKLLLFEIERFKDSEWMIFVCLEDIEAIAKYGLMTDSCLSAAEHYLTAWTLADIFIQCRTFKLS